MEYLLNNFSVKMIKGKFSKTTIINTDHYNEKATSIIGDITLARILGVKYNPSKIELKVGDVVYLASAEYNKDKVNINYFKIRIV